MSGTWLAEPGKKLAMSVMLFNMQYNVRNLSKTNMLLLLEVLLLTTATVGWLSLCTTKCLLAN